MASGGWGPAAKLLLLLLNVTYYYYYVLLSLSLSSLSLYIINSSSSSSSIINVASGGWGPAAARSPWPGSPHLWGGRWGDRAFDSPYTTEYIVLSFDSDVCFMKSGFRTWIRVAIRKRMTLRRLPCDSRPLVGTASVAPRAASRIRASPWLGTACATMNICL